MIATTTAATTTFQSNNTGVGVLITVVSVAVIGMVVYQSSKRKRDESSEMQESESQRRERLASTREKRLRKMDQAQKESELDPGTMKPDETRKAHSPTEANAVIPDLSESQVNISSAESKKSQSMDTDTSVAQGADDRKPKTPVSNSSQTAKSIQSDKDTFTSEMVVDDNRGTMSATKNFHEEKQGQVIGESKTPSNRQGTARTMIVTPFTPLDAGKGTSNAGGILSPSESTTLSDHKDSQQTEVTPIKSLPGDDKDSSTVHDKPSLTQKKKKKTRLMSPHPPPQLVCEALSQIFQCNVTVESNSNAGTWGGQEWKKRSSFMFSSKAAVALPLHLNKPTSMENEWSELATVFPNILTRNLCTKLFPSRDIRQAILFYKQASDLSRNGFTNFNPNYEGFEELKSCVDKLSSWLVEQVATWIRPDVERTRNGMEAATEDLGDLFSDGYGGDDMSFEDTTANRGPLGLLFSCLEEVSSPVTTGFLEDLFQVYDQTSACDESLAKMFLLYALQQVASSKQSRSFSCATLSNRVSALSSLLSAESVRKALSLEIGEEVGKMKDKNGREAQAIVHLAPLFEAMAYTIPPAGAELYRIRHQNDPLYPFLRQVDTLDGFPLSTFNIKGSKDELSIAMQDARRSMSTTQTVSAKQALKSAAFKQDRDQTFDWITALIRSNECLLNVLKNDLLESDGLLALSSTRDFLIGLTWSLVSLSTDLGPKVLDKKGADAFDVLFLRDALNDTNQEPVSDRNRLFQCSSPTGAEGIKARSDGATRFFFLSSLLLRVGLYPLLRMEEEFDFRYSQAIDKVQGAALADNSPPSAAFQNSSPLIAAWLGWRTFLYNQDFASSITDFALMQLSWLVEMARTNANHLSEIPEWFCREPARWITHLASLSSRSLNAAQADKAIQYTTMLLDLAASDPESNQDGFVFSQQVATSLIEVLASFVRAGVQRARRKEQRRKRAGPSEVSDDRNLDVYLSMDRNDLGVTVFTHPLVQQKLAPTLLRTFLAVDSAEGVDADLDNFSKLSAKSQIAELVNRLWCHPSGHCRESVSTLPPQDILAFASSVSSVARVDLNFGIGAIEKTNDSDRIRDQDISQAAGMLLGVRRFLSLLCSMSQDERISSYLGGYSIAQDCDAFVTSLADLIVQFLETLTSQDGGTKQSIDGEDVEPTSGALAVVSGLSRTEKKSLVEDIVGRRIRAKRNFGLDVSVMCHQVLALAAKWHLAGAKMDSSQAGKSLLLSRLAANDDCDVGHIKNVFRRLVAVPANLQGSEVDNAVIILEHDGYVDHTPWMHKYEDTTESEGRKRIRVTASQDQMKHEDLSQIASNDEIEKFIGDLDREISKRSKEMKVISREDEEQAQLSIFSQEATLDEDGFSSNLSSEWVLSSSDFKDSNKTKFLHKYDKTARNRSVQVSTRVVMKEAKKYRRILPSPSSKSAIYVCFDEERTDLARVLVSGPDSTPYSLGLFEFDVFFPPNYPQVPPLVTFMTTGGGRVRFNPNLYTDGKVCISLLGVTTASDEVGRWNPEVSTLAQLMLSVQSQILGVSDPYFNEGNGVPEAMRNTDAGRRASFKYNNTIRLETLRCAMVGHLQSPPVGFDDVTTRHFAMCRQRIVVQARRWMLEARDTDIFFRYERTYSQLVSLLDDEKLKTYDCLPPFPEDLEALESLDPTFLRQIGYGDNENGGNNEEYQYEEEDHLGDPQLDVLFYILAGVALSGAATNPWE